MCGVVTYSNTSKREFLGIQDELLLKYGAVSEQVAKAMAESIRKISDVNLSVSTTGIAGPTGGTKEKPIGLVYIGFSSSNGTHVHRFLFSGDRIRIKEETCSAALKILFEHLTK